MTSFIKFAFAIFLLLYSNVMFADASNGSETISPIEGVNQSKAETKSEAVKDGAKSSNDKQVELVFKSDDIEFNSYLTKVLLVSVILLPLVFLVLFKFKKRLSGMGIALSSSEKLILIKDRQLLSRDSAVYVLNVASRDYIVLVGNGFGSVTKINEADSSLSSIPLEGRGE